MSGGVTAKSQAQPGSVSYPMIGFPGKNSSNNWGGLLQEITTNKFNKYLEANDKDAFYYNFLMEAPKPKIANKDHLERKLTDSQLTEEQIESKKLLLEGVRQIVSHSKKRQQTQRKTGIISKNSTEVLPPAVEPIQPTAFADLRNTITRKRAPSFEKLNRYPDPPTLDELGVVLQRKEDECYLLKNMTNRRLYILVLKLMVEQFKLSPKYFTRRKSATNLDSGGDCLKLSALTGAEAEETLYKDLLTLHFCKQHASRSSSQRDTPQELECPWYLDPNPLSLADSLEGLKQALTKLASEKEAVVYKYYSATGNLLPHAQKFDPSLSAARLSPEGVQSIGSPSKLKNLPKDRPISPMSRKDSGTFKFLFGPEQPRGSSRSINMGNAEAQRKNSVFMANNPDNVAASKSNFRGSKAGFSLNGFKELEEELYLMDKVREIVAFAGGIRAPGLSKNILATILASGQSLPKHESARMLADPIDPVIERRQSEFAPRQSVQRSGPVRFTVDPQSSKWEGPDAVTLIVTERKPQPGMAPLLRLPRESSAHKSVSIIGDQSLLDKSVSRKDTGPSHLK